MGTRIVRYRESIPGHDGDLIPATGSYQFTPTRARVIPGDPDVEVLPVPFSKPLVQGALDVSLEITSPSWVWKVERHILGLHVFDFGINDVEYVVVPYGSEPIDQTDLVRVDPETLEVEPDPTPAWAAAMEALDEKVDDAVDTFNAFDLDVSAAGLSAGSSPTVAVTGEVPNLVIAFGIPKGDKGEKGDNNVLSIGSVTTGAAGSAADVSISGSSPSQVLNFTIPKGDKGDKGDPNVLSVGTVLTGAAGSNAEAAITGSSPSQVLNLVIPQGIKGDTGSTNELNIGTVTTGIPGSSAAASVTGAAPSQTLNLTIPRGDKGEKGDNNVLSIGSVTTGAAGSAASVTVTGSSPSQVLNFTIPKGDLGNTGPANSLVIGTVTTGAAGTNASATITGSAPSQTLNMTIPKGDPGTPSSIFTTKGDVLVGQAANTPVRLPVGADGSIPVANSYETLGLQYQRPMPFLINLLANSDFSGGTTGWNVNNGNTGAVVGGSYVVTITNADLGSQSISQAVPTPTVAGRVYYMACTLTPFATHIPLLRVGNTNAAAATIPAGVASRVSARIVASTSGSSNAVFYTNGASRDGQANGLTATFDNMVCIDLTACFGAGLEPTLAEMDDIMARYPNSWFDKETPQLLPTYDWLKRTQNSATNLVLNGDFSNGTTGWTTASGTLTASLGVATQTGDGTSSNSPFYQVLIGIPGRKYYIRADVRVSATPSYIQLYLTGSQLNITAPAANAWTAVSAIAQPSISTAPFYINALWPDAATQEGKVFYTKNVLVLDLTKMFGSGKEPTVTEMDYLLTKYPNSWFNGVVNDMLRYYDPMRRIGKGSPYNVITPRVKGETWTDIDQTLGARVWTATGTTTTSWVVTDGDTGWRDIRSLISSTVAPLDSSTDCFRIRRINNTVFFEGRLNPAGATIGANKSIAIEVLNPVPSGFIPGSYQSYGIARNSTAIGMFGSISGYTNRLAIQFSAVILSGVWVSTDGINVVASWSSPSTWPTTLPGSAI